jgi:large subunit ribosomal protein L29
MAKDNKVYAELSALDDGRLGRELEDAQRQLFTLRLQIATRQLQDVNQVRRARRRIARIKTLQRQRELAGAGGSR